MEMQNQTPPAPDAPTDAPNPPGMQDYHVTALSPIEEVVPASSARDAVLRYLLSNPDDEITHVGSREVIGVDVTGLIVLEGDRYVQNQNPDELILKKAYDGYGEDERVFDAPPGDDTEDEPSPRDAALVGGDPTP